MRGCSRIIELIVWRSIAAARTSLSAVALAIRGPGSNTDEATKISCGPRTASTVRPKDDVRLSFTLSETTM